MNKTIKEYIDKSSIKTYRINTEYEGVYIIYDEINDNYNIKIDKDIFKINLKEYIIRFEIDIDDYSYEINLDNFKNKLKEDENFYFQEFDYINHNIVGNRKPFLKDLNLLNYYDNEEFEINKINYKINVIFKVLKVISLKNKIICFNFKELIKEYKCDNCENKYIYYNHLYNHLKNKHDIII